MSHGGRAMFKYSTHISGILERCLDAVDIYTGRSLWPRNASARPGCCCCCMDQQLVVARHGRRPCRRSQCCAASVLFLFRRLQYRIRRVDTCRRSCVHHRSDLTFYTDVADSLAFHNSWPTFSPYLYNTVWSELTCCNSLSHSRLACSRLSAHIQPTVNKTRTATDESVNKLQRSWIKLVRPLPTVE